MVVAHFPDLNTLTDVSCLREWSGLLRKPDTSGLYRPSQDYLIGQNGPFSRKQSARLHAREVLNARQRQRRLQLPHLGDKDGVASFSRFKWGNGSNQPRGRIGRVLTRSAFSAAAACVPPRTPAAETSPSPSCTGTWTWCPCAPFLLTSSKCKPQPATLALTTFSRSSLGMRAENSICG